MKTAVKEDNLIKLIELYLISLKKEQQDKKDHFDEFAQEVLDLKNSGEIDDKDILKLQYKENLGMTTFMRLSGYLTKSLVSGLTYNEALELGHKIQFAALSYAQENNLDVQRAFRESMKPHEDGIQQIYDGTYDTTKLAVLKSLPSISNWDHKLGADAWINFLKL